MWDVDNQNLKLSSRSDGDGNPNVATYHGEKINGVALKLLKKKNWYAPKRRYLPSVIGPPQFIRLTSAHKWYRPRRY